MPWVGDLVSMISKRTQRIEVLKIYSIGSFNFVVSRGGAATTSTEITRGADKAFLYTTAKTMGVSLSELVARGAACMESARLRCPPGPGESRANKARGRVRRGAAWDIQKRPLQSAPRRSSAGNECVDGLR